MSAVQEFSSMGEFLKRVEEEIEALRKTMGNFLRRLEEARIKAESEKRLKEILAKFGQQVATEVKPIEIRGTRIYVNPPAEIEYRLYEELIEGLNKRIQALQALRKDLEPLFNVEVEMKITVIYEAGVPKTVILKY